MKKSELVKIIKEELQGYSPQIGKTKGLTPDTLNKILKKIASGDDYEPEGEVDEKKRPGLWANINAKRKRGEKPSHGNSKAHKDAVAAGKKINTKEDVGSSSKGNVAIEKELEKAMQQAGQQIATAAKSAKVAKEDNPDSVQEGVVLTLGLIAGAPGLIEFLGKAVNFIGKVFGAKAGTQVGTYLTKIGHKFEDFYISSIGTWLLKAFPEKFKGQNPNDVSSSLHDYAHGIYLALISALAIGAGVQAAKALQLAVAATEGGLAGLKSYEVLKLAKDIAKFGVKV